MFSLLNNILKIMKVWWPQFENFIQNIHTHLHKCIHNVTIWCGFWAGGIIGSYFFENEIGQATVNDTRYRDIITQFFLPKLDDIDMANLWFQ